MKILFFIKKYLLKHKVDMIWFISFGLVLWVLGILSPFVVGNYIDTLVAYSDESLIWYTVIALAVIWTLQLVLAYVRNIISAKVNSRIGFAVRYDLMEHLKRLPTRYFNDKDSAYVNQRVSMDSGSVTGFVLGSMAGLLTTILTFTLALVIMFFLNTAMTLMICLLFPVYILIYLKFRQPLYEMGYKLAEESNEFHGRTNKQIANIELIKQNAWNEHTNTELKTGFESLFQTTMKNARLSYIFNNADGLVRYMANMIIFIYSGFQIMSGNMTIGQFTMINSYSLMVISSLSTFLGFGRSYRNALISYDRIMEIHNEHPEQSGSICIDRINSITIKNLNLHYNDRHIIRDLSTNLKKGNIYAIVGDNGSGKSTFINILSGMNQDYTGEIYFNSVNLREINVYHLRENLLTVVEQEPTLYFETLRENISLDADKEQSVNYWIKRLGLNALIASLPSGLDYNTSEKTVNLSGGEKQRLVEARAFVKDADLIILDEPSSALDKVGLQVLCEVLREIKINKIIVVVTHDEQLINVSDDVVSFGTLVV